MSASDCPRGNELLAYATGDLPEDAAEQVAMHLDYCGNCQVFIDREMRSEDGLAAPLRRTMMSHAGEVSGYMENLMARAELLAVQTKWISVANAAESEQTESTSLNTTKPVPLANFLHHLTKCGLMSEMDVQKCRMTIHANDSSTFADQLVKKGRLTAYQAKALVLGKSKGLVLGNYVILDKLGQGGMGMVFKARHRRLDRLVALKVLPPAATKSPDLLQRFHREVQTTARMVHKNVVTAFDADEAAGVHFLVMEYFEGSDLGRLVARKGPLPFKAAMRCIRQAAEGLKYAHMMGVVHRDIKPRNLLIDLDGTLKVLDLGLARFANDFTGNNESDTQTDLTSTGMVMGTVDYMSPEQALNTKNADHLSDIYSLGVTLYFLLTGKLMYEGNTVVEKLVAHREQPIPSLHDSREDIPESVNKLFHSMVAKNPDGRPASMQIVIDRLDAVLSGQDHSTQTIRLALADLDDESAATDPEQDQNETEKTDNGIDAVNTVNTATAETAVAARRSARVKKNHRKRLGAILRPTIGILLGIAALVGLVMLVSAGIDALKPLRRVLLVVPHDGVIGADFESVQKAFVDQGFEIVVASSSVGPAKRKEGGQPIQAEVAIAKVAAEDFDTVVFLGGLPWEFYDPNQSKVVTYKFTYELLASRKPVCAVSNGIDVLTKNGLIEKSELKSDGNLQTASSVCGEGQIVYLADSAAAPDLVSHVLNRMKELRTAKSNDLP